MFNRALLALVVASLAITGCALGPDYKRPDIALTTWQAALPHEGSTENLLQWWDQFGDPVMTQLIEAAQKDSPTLEIAAARIAQARSEVTIANASFLPNVEGYGRISRSGVRHQPSEKQTTRLAELDATWEIDLFGAVRRGSESALAQARSREADWHGARISLAAEVATNYLDYRACQQLERAYQQESESQHETSRLTMIAVGAGFSSPADGQLSQAGAANAAANWIAQRAECEVLLKSLVALTAIPELTLRAELEKLPGVLPVPHQFSVATLPISLLSQRPDLVSAEYALVAANAQVGVAQANRLPRLALLGSISSTSVNVSNTGTHITPWSFGPSLTLPIFDAGARLAQYRGAQARYAEALAQYKQAVRNAVKETEQILVKLDSAQQREADAKVAAEGYRAYYNATEIHWRAGGESLLNLETARRSAISSEINLIALERDRVRYWIALYKALGGGWRSASPESESESQASD